MHTVRLLLKFFLRLAYWGLLHRAPHSHLILRSEIDIFMGWKFYPEQHHSETTWKELKSRLSSIYSFTNLKKSFNSVHASHDRNWLYLKQNDKTFVRWSYHCHLLNCTRTTSDSLKRGRYFCHTQFEICD